MSSRQLPKGGRGKTNLSYNIHYGYKYPMKPAKTARAAAPARTRTPATPAPRRAPKSDTARRVRRRVRGRDPAAPWTARDRAGFIRRLAEGQPVAEAARAIGRTPTSALAERNRDPGFAARWDSVVDCAFEVLETRLLSIAIGGVGEEQAEFARAAPSRARDETRLARWILANLRNPRPAPSGTPAPARGRGSRAAPAAMPGPAPAAAPQGLDPVAEQERINRLIDEVAERIAEAEARMAQAPLH